MANTNASETTKSVPACTVAYELKKALKLLDEVGDCINKVNGATFVHMATGTTIHASDVLAALQEVYTQVQELDTARPMVRRKSK